MSQATSSPSAVVVPPPKNRLSGKMPRGVWIHLSSTARVTVVTCTPTTSAICCIFSGTMGSGPLSRNSVWWSTIACATRLQRVVPLLDRLDQPLGRFDLLLDVLLASSGRGCRRSMLRVVLADAQLRRVLVFEPDVVLAVLVRLDGQSGVTFCDGPDFESRPGCGFELLQLFDGFLDRCRCE